MSRIGATERSCRKIAIVATAHYLVRAMAAMMSTGEVWREVAYCHGGSYFEHEYVLVGHTPGIKMAGVE